MNTVEDHPHPRRRGETSVDSSRGAHSRRNSREGGRDPPPATGFTVLSRGAGDGAPPTSNDGARRPKQGLAAPAYDAVQARSVAPAPQRDVPNTQVVDPAYFHNEDWPFAAEQFDREKENLLGNDPQVLAGKGALPQLAPTSFEPIHLQGELASDLAKWDVECAMKHLDAIEGNVLSHDELHSFTLMKGEKAVNAIDLAGVENAPGVLDNVAQRCRLIFTDQNRLIFTQANHSAVVGVPKMHCLFALLACLHDTWSTRKWSAYYASINASDVLQVFVQQTLTTSYRTSKCNFNDVCSALVCSVGGDLYTEKDLDGATQTLGDHDQGACAGRWEKTRFMRHALVIRYVDCSTNTVMQTAAMAHPDTPPVELYEMARAIESNITVTTADWLKCKLVPTPLAAGPFYNGAPSLPIFQRGSYRSFLFLLFIVALFFFIVSVAAAVFMVLAVVVAAAGTFSGAAGRKAASAGTSGLQQLSKTLIGSQVGGAAVYIIALIIAISSDNSDSSSNNTY